MAVARLDQASVNQPIRLRVAIRGKEVLFDTRDTHSDNLLDSLAFKVETERILTKLACLLEEKGETDRSIEIMISKIMYSSDSIMVNIEMMTEITCRYIAQLKSPVLWMDFIFNNISGRGLGTNDIVFLLIKLFKEALLVEKEDRTEADFMRLLLRKDIP